MSTTTPRSLIDRLMEPMPAAPHPTKEGWICIPSIHADAAADLREEAAEALRHASETHAQIVQVLPLAPQPPTITTSTTWNPLPHPQEVINYITEAIEEQSGAHEIVKVSVSKRVLDDIVSLLMGMTSSETKPCQLAGLSRCAQSTNALVAQSLEQPELNRQVEGLRSSERTHPHDKSSEAIAWHEREKAAFEAWWEARGSHKHQEPAHLAAGAAWFGRASASATRASIIEECAKVADPDENGPDGIMFQTAKEIAKHIRALADSTGQKT